jgi:hypothetical protein
MTLVKVVVLSVGQFGPEWAMLVAFLNAICQRLSGGPDRTRICDLYRVKVAL